MKLTAKGEYALRVVLYLAEHEDKGLIKLSEISEKEEISLPYLHQLVKNLKRDGILKSSRGPSGGYSLGRDSDKITVIQVLASAGEQIQSFEMAAKQGSRAGKCLSEFFIQLDQRVLKEFDVKISTLLRKYGV